jgi:hypothetical protein
MAFQRKAPSQLNAEEEVAWHLIHVRTLAYGEYRVTEGVHRLRQIIEEEMIRPDVYHDDGLPLVPVSYLNSAVTTAELDRVADLFDVRLAYADAIIASIQNCCLDRHGWPLRRIASLLWGVERHSWYLRNKIGTTLELPVAILQLELKIAREAAAFLNNPEIYSRLARFWAAADKAVYKFRTWEQQRLVMPSLTKSQVERLRRISSLEGPPI